MLTYSRFSAVINYMIYALSIVAFAYRCADWGTTSQEKSDKFRMLSFREFPFRSSLELCIFERGLDEEMVKMTEGARN